MKHFKNTPGPVYQTTKSKKTTGDMKIPRFDIIKYRVSRNKIFLKPRS